MAHIYISSTYTDLIGAREAVYSALRKMRHDVIAMEDYVSTDQRPLDKCLADVGSCDVYVGIFAWRYGYVPPNQKCSITELEFRQAVQSKKPCLMFLLHEDAPWPPKLIDRDLERIEAFRAELCRDYMVSFFRNFDELAADVAVAVGQHLSDDKKDKGRAGRAEISCDVWLSDDEGGGLEEDFEPEGMEFKYSATQKDGVLFIKPDCPYLDDLYLRGQVSPIYILDPDETSFNLPFPQLDFKIANNSSETVFISRAVFEVEGSRLDPRPVPFFATDPALLFKCRLINDGWGEIKNGSLRYRISKGVEPEGVARKFPFEKTVSIFAEFTELDFSADIQALGVDVEAIQRINADWSEQKIQWDDFQDELRIAKGSFAELEEVSINGVLTYDQPTSGGLFERKDVRFSVNIPITPPEGLGGAALATGTYDVMLDVDRDSYTVVRPLSHAIKKGEVDRFLIRVGAKKSSFHKFKVGLVITGGEELTSQVINLSLFIPRRNAKELSDGDRSGGD